MADMANTENRAARRAGLAGKIKDKPKKLYGHWKKARK